MIFMSVDVGTVRTGIAVCDSSEKFVFPRGIIVERNREQLAIAICQKAEEFKANEIVVGYPKNMDGSEGFKAKECSEMANMIREKCDKKVSLWDERCTTVSAHIELNYSNKRGKARKDIVDAVAATIILEDFLKCRAIKGGNH